MGEESAGLKGKGLQGRMPYRRERGKWGNGRRFCERERGTLERKEPTGGSSLAGWQVGTTCQWKKEERRVTVRGSASWVVGSIQTGPDWLPRSEILFLFFLLSFILF
jgi:hypothetical protein